MHKIEAHNHGQPMFYGDNHAQNKWSSPVWNTGVKKRNLHKTEAHHQGVYPENNRSSSQESNTGFR